MSKWDLEPKKPNIPETLKLEELDERRDAVMKFLEWCQERGVRLCVREEADYKRLRGSKRAIVLKWLNINQTTLDIEHAEILNYLANHKKWRNTL